MSRGEGSGGRGHRFGGAWTVTKLAILKDYLASYTTALQSQPFRTAYIDAFAGTGYRETADSGTESGQNLPFPDLADDEPQDLLDGSARIALQTEPGFDAYIFIERSPTRCEHLEDLRDDFPHHGKQIRVEQGEANERIQALCKDREAWRRRRAVLFLDPYGMQVEWKTIEAIASTKAIDLWILFPLGMGVNRLLPKSGTVPPSWKKRLDLLLGTTDWYEVFYQTERIPTLFGSDKERVVKATTESIGRYFNSRLKEVFAGVAEHPAVLRNSANNPLYLLCFAVGNERGKNLALRIAEHVLLKEVR